MGVYLRDTASTWVPGPINVADELYNQDLPDLSTDPGVIAGGGTSVDEVDQRVGAGVGAVTDQINDATNTAGMNSTQNGDRLVKTRSDGRIYIETNSITQRAHASNKEYVDNRVTAVSPSLLRFVNRTGTEFFDSDLTLPTEGQFHQSAGDQYNIFFTVPVLATVVWDGNTPLSIQSWGTNGSSAVRQIGAIPAADAGVARSFVTILAPTGSRGSIFATGDGSGSHVVWLSLQRLERLV